MAAGLAATAASFVTSRFGVAGTLLGAALTAMIITGGSAILRSYLETVSGRVRGMPTKLRSQRGQQKAGGFNGTMPGRPDLRDNFVGRMRAALDWFSHLPTLTRRSILIKGLLAAAVALVICMGVVWGAEKVIGNSLSCGIWAKCPYGATPGIHPAGYGGTGAGSSISGGGTNTGGDESPRLVDRVRQGARQERNPFGDGRPVLGNPGNGGNRGGAVSSASPDPGAVPRAGGKESAPPAAGKQDAPSNASPAARKQDAPSNASPAARKQDAPSSAQPAAGKQDASSSAQPAADQ
jgi:hypothetical protein